MGDYDIRGSFMYPHCITVYTITNLNLFILYLLQSVSQIAECIGRLHLIPLPTISIEKLLLSFLIKP